MDTQEQLTGSGSEGENLPKSNFDQGGGLADPTSGRTDMWALVELMGRQKIAGRVTEEKIAGAIMLRVDVPKPTGEIAYTRYYSASAIYSISPCDRQIVLGMVAHCHAEPVHRYELGMLAEATDGGQREMEFDDE